MVMQYLKNSKKKKVVNQSQMKKMKVDKKTRVSKHVVDDVVNPIYQTVSTWVAASEKSRAQVPAFKLFQTQTYLVYWIQSVLSIVLCPHNLFCFLSRSPELNNICGRLVSIGAPRCLATAHHYGVPFYRWDHGVIRHGRIFCWWAGSSLTHSKKVIVLVCWLTFRNASNLTVFN